MFPLHDDNPTQDTSIVVYVLILMNVLIYGYQASLPNFQLGEWFGNWAAHVELDIIPDIWQGMTLKKKLTVWL